MPGTQFPISRHADQIIEQIEQGAYIKDIAAQHGVTRAAVSNLMLRVHPERYRLARIVGTESRLEDCLSEIDAANDNVSVARAGTKWRAVSWLAERTLPEVYGAKQELRHTGSVAQVVMSAQDAALCGARVIDAQHSDVSQDSEYPHG